MHLYFIVSPKLHTSAHGTHDQPPRTMQKMALLSVRDHDAVRPLHARTTAGSNRAIAIATGVPGDVAGGNRVYRTRLRGRNGRS